MSKPSLSFLLLLISIFSPFLPIKARDLHTIKFKSPGLYPKGLAYDPDSCISTLHRRISSNKFISISDSGEIETLTLISSEISPNSTILGLSIDHRNQRLLAAINSLSSPLLASFHLHHSYLELQFLCPLSPSVGIACDVTFDPFGNAYVTNSDKNLIYKVTENGTVSVTSNSSIFTHYPVYESSYSYSGLNGVIYINHKNYLLVVQSNTRKLFKVNAINGTATAAILPSDLTLANGIVVKDDGVVVVVSINTAWFLKSDDDWAHGIVIDEIALDTEGYPSSVIVKNGKRVFVIYGYVPESINGNSEEREWNRICVQEIRRMNERPFLN